MFAFFGGVVATSTYTAGQWNVELKPENSVAELGKPIDFFPAPPSSVAVRTRKPLSSG
jgi:hypothetical protein